MPDAPRQIRLAAGDYYMHGQDHKLRRAGLPGYVCRVALRLEDGLDVDLLRRRVETSPVLDWLARVRLTRPLPVFPPLWRTTSRPSPIFFEHNHQDGNGHEPGVLPPAVLERDLHASRGPALAFDLVRHADGTRHLVFSWNHALMDARGAELIWLHLNDGNGGNGAPSLEDLIHPKQRGGSLAEWWAQREAGARLAGMAPQVRERTALLAAAGKTHGRPASQPVPHRDLQRGGNGAHRGPLRAPQRRLPAQSLSPRGHAPGVAHRRHPARQPGRGLFDSRGA